MNALAISALAATLVLAAPVAVPAGAPADHSSARVAAAGAGGEVVNVGTFRLTGFLSFVHVPAKACPNTAPYLDGSEYHPGSGWLIPGGVTIDTRGLFVGANLRPNEGRRGIIGGTITSLSGSGDVTVRLHCTDRG
ncbi:hypothetical protein [Agromyces silvae]|uniref:hypothetical protein n=1 Tax=Agromyces silvae TaxID=3388266 RepID=UPI00280AAC65|nr:hypothetical protein [Agromyces protaetiae]